MTCLTRHLQVRVVDDETGCIVIERQRLSIPGTCLGQSFAPRPHAQHERDEKRKKKTAQRFQLITQLVRWLSQETGYDKLSTFTP